MGSIGGGIWHYFKGVRNAPKGERLRGGISSVKARAPLVGGRWLGWGMTMWGGGRLGDEYGLAFGGAEAHLCSCSLSSRCLL